VVIGSNPIFSSQIKELQERDYLRERISSVGKSTSITLFGNSHQVFLGVVQSMDTSIITEKRSILNYSRPLFLAQFR
jgi:hypothetical protein